MCCSGASSSPRGGRGWPRGPGPTCSCSARFLLALVGVGFWLDRFELVYSPRGVVFGATYTDVHAALPALGVLTVLALVTAGACLAQLARPGLRLVAVALAALVGGVGPRARHLPGYSAALPGRPQRARGRATRTSSTTSA